DLVLWRQPAGTDGVAVAVAGQYVVAAFVEVVPFEFDRHVLLVDEDGLADRAQRAEITVPVGALDVEPGCLHRTFRSTRWPASSSASSTARSPAGRRVSKAGSGEAH